MTAKTGFVWHERYMWHMTGFAAGPVPAGGLVEPDIHIENPAAKRRMRNLLEVTGVLDALTPIRPRAATEAEVLCGGRLLFCHEGGYSPAYAPWCGLAVMETLAGLPETPDPFAHLAAMGGQGLKPAETAVIDQAVALIDKIPAP